MGLLINAAYMQAAFPHFFETSQGAQTGFESAHPARERALVAGAMWRMRQRNRSSRRAGALHINP
jgi:hypothetical protein